MTQTPPTSVPTPVGLGYRDEPMAGDFLKRRSFLSCLGSMSDITSPPADLILDRGCGQVRPRKFGSVGGACWETSTSSRASSEPVTFDPARISAWLGKTPRDDPFFSGPTLRDPGSQSCSRSVQTDLQSPDPDSSAVLTNTPTLTLALAFPCQSYSPGDSPSPVPPLTVQSPVPLTSWEPTDWGQRSPQSWEDRPSAKCAMSHVP
ncbi:uncharacterized protein LOC124465409 [Hypomesus transpacificus]|uniref:uncharacterized protein LOC124465409 n=1 Tax=Hypomesus transpacificus TaxID=137520 RepID=UPI001F08692D|nr:uncharacterized protein LOC124465409 [Hypomesus transpacificus]